MLYKALQYLITGLVEEPQNVAVDRIETLEVDLFYLSSPKGELGRLLGRQGRTVEAMRDVLTAIARKLEKEAIIDVIEQRLGISTSSNDQPERGQRPPHHERRTRHPQQRRGGRGGGSPRPGQRSRDQRPRDRNGARKNVPPKEPSPS